MYQGTEFRNGGFLDVLILRSALLGTSQRRSTMPKLVAFRILEIVPI